jgi:general secretion pathway protein G
MSTARRQGFTLIELIIVLSIIGILLGLALPEYRNSVKKTREAVLKEDLFRFRELIDQYYHDKGKYPLTLQTLVDEAYLRKMPEDPMTKSAATWVEIREQPSLEDYMPTGQLGVIDVHSGSEAKALDGTLYNTW